MGIVPGNLLQKGEWLSHIFCSPPLWLTALLPTCSRDLTITISCFHLPKISFVSIAISGCSLFCGRQQAVKCIDPDAACHLSQQKKNHYLERLYLQISQLQTCTLLRLWLQNLFFSELMHFKTYMKKELVNIYFVFLIKRYFSQNIDIAKMTD